MLKQAYLFDSCSALAVFLFSFVFGTFNVGYYAYGSFWGFAIGSMIAGLLRIACNPKATFASSLIGLAVIVVMSIAVIKMVPIEIRDFGDVVMPYINLALNGVIYLFITHAFSRFAKKRIASMAKDR